MGVTYGRTATTPFKDIQHVLQNAKISGITAMCKVFLLEDVLLALEKPATTVPLSGLVDVKFVGGNVTSKGKRAPGPQKDDVNRNK